MAETVGTRPRGLLIFDGDCGFCTTGVHKLVEMLPSPPDTIPYQFADLAQYGLTAEECNERIWLVTPNQQLGGYVALSEVFKRQPKRWYRFLGHLSDTFPFSFVSAAGYSWMAKNRQRLPGGTPACAMRPPQQA